jgi:hypothetical protein
MKAFAKECKVVKFRDSGPVRADMKAVIRVTHVPTGSVVYGAVPFRGLKHGHVDALIEGLRLAIAEQENDLILPNPVFESPN